MPSLTTPTEWDLKNNNQVVGAITDVPTIQFTVGAEAADSINVAIQLSDEKGRDVTELVSFFAWLSDTAAGAVTGTVPDGDVAIGTDGLILLEHTTDIVFELLTSATGAIDLDIGESLADTWYLNIRLPGGQVVSSPAITFA